MTVIATTPQRSNIHEQLSKKYLAACTAPLPDVIKVPAMDPKTLKIVWMDCHVMGPHLWFSWMANEFPTDFERIFGTEKLVSFWSQVSRPSWLCEFDVHA